MLTHIHIQNFTIVDSLSIDFHHGLSVLTGETGAGKSIWVDAIGLALGNRAESSIIRHGQNRCDITLCFDISRIPQARAWLEEQQFASDDECIIRRTISRESAARSTINGHPCPLMLAREFADLVLNIHGQHQHQALLQRDAQRHCLDQYGKHGVWLQDLQRIYHKWKHLNAELTALKTQAAARDAELDLLRYQYTEICQIALGENEWDELSQKHQQLHNAKSLILHLNQAINLTIENEEISASLLLQEAIDQLDEIRSADEQIIAIKELLQTASIHLQEAGNDLNHYRNHIDLSPEHLSTIEERLSLIHDIARKHHVTPNELHDMQKSLAHKIDALENIDIHIETLQKTQQLLQQQYHKTAAELTKSRQQCAKAITKKVTEHMQRLGMKGGIFDVSLVANEAPLSLFGNEIVLFSVSTNPGQPLQPLAKVVSGGELSRISLALQVITAQKEGTPTLIFDEVDTGIGGATAETVGQLLRELGANTQVLCITHLPQVAAQGHQHYQVSKVSTNNSTHTQIKHLSNEERTEELTRMLGGIACQTLTN